jgi:phage tail-like protein
MAETRPVRPHGNAHFLVEIGRASGRAPEAGFSEVIFPRFVAASAERRPASAAGASEAAGAAREDCLVLRRGATGALDLYRWWQAAHSGDAKRGRVVTVKLLADDQATVAMTWRFRNARPVALSYSPLHALDGSVLLETIELAFDSVEMT